MARKKTFPKTLIAREKGGNRRVNQMGWDEGSTKARLSTKRFSYHSDPFTLLCMKILKEQNPTIFRSLHVEKAAINALQKSAEDVLVSVLSGAAVLAEHAGRETLSKKDFDALRGLAKFGAVNMPGTGGA
ncbi:centromeric DNA-binding histone H3-like protein cse4 [Fusarium equiseti]|uniref:Centromeric DNA-binding histone H3-like protein cse4 n=1 Tax=Fusarium equiseti TaxID=61235 RepID=A0ABQ8QXB8_FUSEQ|nr:centromeric DNA-binding histone H3-like protein cse4 [Fusarium equiseti]